LPMSNSLVPGAPAATLAISATPFQNPIAHCGEY
jgi:hypothetical protein